MHPVEFIRTKRDGGRHTKQALETFLNAYLGGRIPDYQLAAWLMAVYFRGMDEDETLALTQVMAQSGETLDLSALGETVDKHSSGGVGDKTSLVVLPILAACGLVVAKMSGRGLAHTGGTIDKLESIPGWSGELDEESFLRQAEGVGMVLVGQSKDLAPADGQLYALRDVTATVDSTPLIASSIMSKKLAAGARTIVLDVKVGRGAFMKSLTEARELAGLMVRIGRAAGRRVRAVLSQMDQPLGHTVGNAIEVREAIATLKGEGSDDLRRLALRLAEEALTAAGRPTGQAREALDSGAALSKFRAFVEAQGGDGRVVEDQNLLPLAPGIFEIRAQTDGGVLELDAHRVGQAALWLGGGREAKGKPIDHSVGVYLEKKIGDSVRTGEVLARIYHRNGYGLDEAASAIQTAYVLGDSASTPPLVLEVLT